MPRLARIVVGSPAAIKANVDPVRALGLFYCPTRPVVGHTIKLVDQRIHFTVSGEFPF